MEESSSVWKRWDGKRRNSEKEGGRKKKNENERVDWETEMNRLKV